jgi:hypothetical protein
MTVDLDMCQVTVRPQRTIIRLSATFVAWTAAAFSLDALQLNLNKTEAWGKIVEVVQGALNKVDAAQLPNDGARTIFSASQVGRSANGSGVARPLTCAAGTLKPEAVCLEFPAANSSTESLRALMGLGGVPKGAQSMIRKGREVMLQALCITALFFFEKVVPSAGYTSTQVLALRAALTHSINFNDPTAALAADPYKDVLIEVGGGSLRFISVAWTVATLISATPLSLHYLTYGK